MSQAGAALYDPSEQMRQGVKNILIDAFGFRPEGYGRGVAKMLPAKAPTTAAVTDPTVTATGQVPGSSVTLPTTATASGGKGVGGFTGKVLGPTGSNTITVSGEDGSQRVVSVGGNYGVEGGSPNMSPIEYRKSIGMGVDSINPYDTQFQDMITAAARSIADRANTTTGNPSHDRWLKASIPKALQGLAALVGPMTSQGQYGISQNVLEETSRHNMAGEGIEGGKLGVQAGALDIARQKLPVEMEHLKTQTGEAKAKGGLDVLTKLLPKKYTYDEMGQKTRETPDLSGIDVIAPIVRELQLTGTMSDESRKNLAGLSRPQLTSEQARAEIKRRQQEAKKNG